MTRLEELAREAAALPKEQRWSLVRSLLELDQKTAVTESTETWDAEIRSRIKAVDAGRAESVSFSQLKREMDERLGE